MILGSATRRGESKVARLVGLSLSFFRNTTTSLYCYPSASVVVGEVTATVVWKVLGLLDSGKRRRCIPYKGVIRFRYGGNRTCLWQFFYRDLWEALASSWHRWWS